MQAGNYVRTAKDLASARNFLGALESLTLALSTYEK